MLSSQISLSQAAEMPFDDLWRIAAPPMPSPAMLLPGHPREQADEALVLHGLGGVGFGAPSFFFPTNALPTPRGRMHPSLQAPAPTLGPAPAPTPRPGGVPEPKAPRRVRRSVLSRLDQRKATREDTQQVCNICMDHFARGTRLTTLPCEHTFCSDCITPWLARHATCPVCRWKFPEEQTDTAPIQLAV